MQINIKNILGNKKILIPSIAVIILLITAIIFFSLFITQYALSDKVQVSADSIPGNIKYYIEIKNPSEFIENLGKRPYGRDILDNEAFKKFALAEQVKKFSSLLYIIQLRGGAMLKYEEIASFFDGSAGYGAMPDGSFICIAKLSMKSKLGLMLAAKFKGETVDIKPERTETTVKKQVQAEDGENIENVNADSFKNQYEEEKVDLGNISVSAVKFSGKTIYVTVLNNFLFISDSLDTLKLSLETGTSARNSVTSYTGGDHLKKTYEETDLMFFVSGTDGLLSVFSPVFVKGKALAGLIHFDDTISMDLVNLGFELDGKGNPPEPGFNDESSVKFDSMIPMDSTASLFIYDKSFADFSSVFKDSGADDDTIDEFKSLFENSGFNSIDYFSPGAAAVLKKLNIDENRLFPEFIIAIPSQGGEKIASLIFKKSGIKDMKYQKIDFRVFRKASPESVYSPAVIIRDKISFIASTEQNAMDVISSLNRNNAVVSDNPSYSILKKFTAPCRLVVNLNSLLEDLKTFYYSGVENGGSYSRITIDNDILPLFDFLKRFSDINIAFGNEGPVNGKGVFSKIDD